MWYQHRRLVALQAMGRVQQLVRANLVCCLLCEHGQPTFAYGRSKTRSTHSVAPVEFPSVSPHFCTLR
jgi:hypothetical protein